jgi:pyrroline-5-carboxylate reductase
MAYALGILGAGNMAEAIARGVTSRGLFSPDQIIAADVSEDRRKLFTNELKIRAVEDNLDVARQSRTILLSVKPQQMATALAGIGEVLSPDALIVSIAAGISTTFIEKHLGGTSRWRVIRTMPNTPILVGEGMVAMAPGAHATGEDLAQARQIFESAAKVIEVNEDQLDAVTAVSGSGPAYFFYLVEQMIHAGIEIGLSPEHAKQLASQTAVGAAKMLATPTDSPQELRRKVTSPGGTTQAAIEHLDAHAVGPAIVDAIKAAAKRSKELGT